MRILSRRIAAILTLLVTFAVPCAAQITVPNTLVAGATIRAGDLNTNFSTLGNHALDRISGGTISGNVTLDPGITIDGIDLSTALCTTCAATFGSVVATNGLTVNGIGIIPASGKIPALTSSYFTSLAFDAANLTGTAAAINGSLITALNGSNIATGTVATARLGSGSPGATNFLRGDGAWAGVTNALVGYTVTSKSAIYTAVTSDEVILANGTFTVTLYTCVGNAGKTLIIKNTGSGTITLDGNAAETIDGALTFTNSVQYQSQTLVCDGSNWSII